MTRGGDGLRERETSCGSCISVPSWEGMGRGAVGGGGGAPDGRPAGNGGGGPGSSSARLSCLPSELGGGGRDSEVDREGGVGVGVSTGDISP